MPGTNVLVLVGLVFYLAASLLLWRLLLKEPPPMAPRRSRPRWPLRLAKAFATLIGGTAPLSGGGCGRRLHPRARSGSGDGLGAWPLAGGPGRRR